MVSLRGISTKGLSQVRKFNKSVENNKIGRSLYNSVLRGDSITNIQRTLRSGGVKVSKLTLERSLFERYNVKTVGRYYDQLRTNYGGVNGFNLGTLQRLKADNTIKVQLRGTTKSGQVYNFDTYVNVGDTESLADVLDNLREIYEEDNEENKSPLKGLEFR